MDWRTDHGEGRKVYVCGDDEYGQLGLGERWKTLAEKSTLSGRERTGMIVVVASA